MNPDEILRLIRDADVFEVVTRWMQIEKAARFVVGAFDQENDEQLADSIAELRAALDLVVGPRR